jgi:hypothetical protein
VIVLKIILWLAFFASAVLMSIVILIRNTWGKSRES